MRWFLPLCFAFIALWLSAASTQADSTRQLDITRATLVAESIYIEPGKPFKLGVLLEPEYGWHSYWENPADAGLASELSWKLPEGFSAGVIEWPVPERIDEGPLTVYGYHNTVFLPVTITPPASLSENETYRVSVKANWLICKDICIPESAELDIDLTVGAASPSMNAYHFESHKEKTPKKIAEPFSFSTQEKLLTLEIPLASLSLESASRAEFFIRQMNVIRYAATPELTVNNGIVHIKLNTTNTPPNSISGILVLEDGSGAPHHFDLTFNKKKIATPATTTEQQSAPFLPLILGLALLGGLILNLMPCVLPVLSLKALTLVKKGTSDKATARKHGIAYTAGILTSFAMLAGFLIVLQQTGEAVGWGYQMQSPVFVGILVYLLFLVGLNLSGVFDLPVLLGNTGSTLTSGSRPRSSFFTGILATAVATPCTAPFMASAVGIALTLPPWQAMLVFEALGLGLALPFLLVSFFPALLRFLPKPGAWMESFKQFLAFPMYASVIWLLWVLTLQTGAGGAVLVLSGMLLLVIIIWMRRLFDNSHSYRIVALVMTGVMLVSTLQMLKNGDGKSPLETLPPEYSDVSTVPYSPESLTRLQAEGKAVFVDATAAWCITCQVNAKTALHTDRVMTAFKEKNITFMIADWTKRNPKIKEFLNSFGYQGVPLYVYYPADGSKPVVLPQILTPGIILDAINYKND